MRYYETKIGQIIKEEFDFRMSNAVISYIMTKGIDNIKEITDSQIEKIEGNGLFSKEFNQALVRCARKICIECDWFEVVKFIRLYLPCEPSVNEITLYRDDLTKEAFQDLLHDLNVDDDEVGEFIQLYAIVDTDF